jgi:hypothetical protein
VNKFFKEERLIDFSRLYYNKIMSYQGSEYLENLLENTSQQETGDFLNTASVTFPYNPTFANSAL